MTRIPPRFQKQRPSANQHQASEKALGLPRATSRTAPATAKQLTIFGTSNVVNNLNESELGDDLGVPVRIIPAMKLDVFKEKIAMVDPEKDRLILIHGLGNDARNIGKFRLIFKIPLGGVHILRRQLGGREVFAKSLRLSTRGREGYSKCLRSFF